MGFVTGTIRLLYLQQIKSNLEHKIMQITESQMDLSQSITDLNDIGTDLDPDSPVVKSMKAKRLKIEQTEKELNRRMAQYKAKLDAVNTEIKQAEGMVTHSARESFTYGMGRGDG